MVEKREGRCSERRVSALVALLDKASLLVPEGRATKVVQFSALLNQI